MKSHCSSQKGRRGFTIIELLVVMAISGILLALSTALLQSLGETQAVKTEAYNTLLSLTEARDNALNTRIQSINSGYVYGYVYMLYPAGGNIHGYCVYAWLAPGGNTNPTATNFTFPGTLSENLASSSPPTIPTGVIGPVCNANASSVGNFTLLDNKLIDNKPNMCFQFTPVNQVAYVVYENGTGDVYFFDSNGNHASPTSVKMTVDDNSCSGGNNQQSITIYTPNASTNPVSYYETPFIN